MFSKRNVPVVILVVMFTLLILNNVMADDGRINRAPYHFGGDTLFCTEEAGCTLLDKTGHELANWSTDSIATAFHTADTSGQNTKVNGDKQGTYGPMQLWAVSPDATTGNNTLCMIGFDEWGKQNDMCFEVTKDYHFEQAGLPVSKPAKTDEPKSELTDEPTVTPTDTVTPSLTPPPTITTPTATPTDTATPEITPNPF